MKKSARSVLVPIILVIVLGRGVAFSGDLGILAFNAPDRVMPGARIGEEVTVNIRNSSSFRVYSDIEVFVTLSSRPGSGRGDLLVSDGYRDGAVLVGGEGACFLSPNMNRWVPFPNLTIPSDVAPGSYHLTVIARPTDSRRQRTGGTAVAHAAVTIKDPAAANLVASLDAPQGAVAGRTIKDRLTVRVKNTGRAEVRNVPVELRLASRRELSGSSSESSTYRDGMVLPGGRTEISRILPGRSADVSFPGSLTIPADAPRRRLFLVVMVDPAGSIPVQDPDLRTVAHPLRVEPELPDLSGSIRLEGSMFVSPGESLQGRVIATVTNTGHLAVDEPFNVIVMLNSDARINMRRAQYSERYRSNVILHGGRVRVNRLAVDETKQLPLTGGLIIPPSTPRGSYYLAIGIDPDAAIEELSRDNNVAMCRLTVR